MSVKILPYLKRWKHRIYVEPFGGGASMLFAKLPAKVEVYNDLDSGLYNFFCVLSDPRDFARFYRRVQPLMYSRELYNDCRKTWAETEDKIDRAVKWFVVARMAFSGDFAHSWGSVVTTSARGMAGTSSKWLSIIDQLPEVHARISRVQIEHADFRDILTRYDTPETLFYLDPPYVAETRSSGGYAHELSADDHSDMVDLLAKIEGAAVLSGYPTTMYDRLGWHRVDFETSCHAAGKTRGTGLQGKGSALEHQKRTECLWVHPRIFDDEDGLLF